MDKLTCFFKKAFDFSHQNVWLEVGPKPEQEPAPGSSVARKGSETGRVDLVGDPHNLQAELIRGDSREPQPKTSPDVQAALDKGGPLKVNTYKREKDRSVADASGILGMFERGVATIPSTSLDESADLLAQQRASAAADNAIPPPRVEARDAIDRSATRNLGIGSAVATGGRIQEYEQSEFDPHYAVAATSPAAEAAIDASIATPAAKDQMLAESAANREYAQDQVLAGAKDYLEKSVSSGQRGLETTDDSKIIQALIVTAGGPSAWTQFVTEYKAKAAEGKLNNGKAIETWQRNWIANPEHGCSRPDVYADVAELKARLGKNTETTVQYAGKEGGQTKEKPFDILRYELSNALGIKDGNPLSGRDLYELYAAGQYPPGVLPVDIGVKGTKVTVNSGTGDISVKGPGETAVATIKRPSQDAVAAKLRQLGR